MPPTVAVEPNPLLAHLGGGPLSRVLPSNDLFGVAGELHGDVMAVDTFRLAAGIGNEARFQGSNGASLLQAPCSSRYRHPDLLSRPLPVNGQRHVDHLARGDAALKSPPKLTGPLTKLIQVIRRHRANLAAKHGHHQPAGVDRHVARTHLLRRQNVLRLGALAELFALDLLRLGGAAAEPCYRPRVASHQP